MNRARQPRGSRHPAATLIALLAASMLHACAEPPPPRQTGGSYLLLESKGSCRIPVFITVKSDDVDDVYEIMGKTVAFADVSRTLEVDLRHDKTCAVWIVPAKDPPTFDAARLMIALKVAGFKNVAMTPVSPETQ